MDKIWTIFYNWTFTRVRKNLNKFLLFFHTVLEMNFIPLLNFPSISLSCHLFHLNNSIRYYLKKAVPLSVLSSFVPPLGAPNEGALYYESIIWSILNWLDSCFLYDLFVARIFQSNYPIPPPSLSFRALIVQFYYSRMYG